MGVNESVLSAIEWRNRTFSLVTVKSANLTYRYPISIVQQQPSQHYVVQLSNKEASPIDNTQIFGNEDTSDNGYLTYVHVWFTTFNIYVYSNE